MPVESPLSAIIHSYTSYVHGPVQFRVFKRVLPWNFGRHPYRVPPHECSRYGPFGYCDNTVAAPSCDCLDGFEPASPSEWSIGRFSQGCRRKEELKCSVSDGKGDDFLAMPAMKAPDRFVLVRNRAAAACAEECARNCSCMAYAHANLSSSSRARGDTTRHKGEECNENYIASFSKYFGARLLTRCAMGL
ncbi:LOW QUALITY PROTEIN: hypothetical protein BRADI_5g11135v3 [Brachypodium distachyon]|uniref:Apple domain-containing protein n=1 Tax=Brachypodium distachyon TaxID=15368 RepID=A0A2K2CGL7_BRADI|nr:LOW QUALITY PROTEIN: hypothetical protein BRADI_5g11135v3 [Brachypodium distachyon]